MRAAPALLVCCSPDRAWGHARRVAAIIGLLVVFTFVPVKFIHPVRVRDFRQITIPVLVVWLAALLYLTWIIDDQTRGCASACLPTAARAAQGVVYAGALWIIGVGIWRTFRGDPHPVAQPTAT